MISPVDSTALLAANSSLNSLPVNPLAGAGAMNMSQIDSASKDFESMFIGQMLEQMYGDSEGTEAFGDSETSDIYKSMMMDEYGKQIARAGGIGIADYVKQELLKLQEKQS